MRVGSIVSILLLVMSRVAVAEPLGSAGSPQYAPLAVTAFAEHGVQGVFVTFDPASESWATNDAGRAERGFLPASTFKIFNTLVALETGVLADEHVVLPWDGVERGNDDWDRDHDLASALRVSAVWFYQEVARRIGRERMQDWIDRVGYGNRDIGGAIDTFWLEGGLRISPRQQIEFLVRLHDGALPFSARAMAITRRILQRDERDGVVLRGKTGWAARGKPQAGWFVGWVERGESVRYFALNMDIADDAQGRLREPLAREILTALGWWPAGGS